MKNGFVAQAAQASMTVNNFNAFPNNDISKDWKEREDSRKGRFPVDDEEWDMIYLKSVREIPNTAATFVGVGDNHYLVSTIYEFRGQLVYMAFDAAWLGKEEVADHSNVVRHLCSPSLTSGNAGQTSSIFAS